MALEKLHGIEQDVWGPAQQAVSDELKESCDALAKMLCEAQAKYSSGVRTASVDFHGYFADLFQENARIAAKDSADLMSALSAISNGIVRAQEAARNEQARRERAREFMRAHKNWQWWHDSLVGDVADLFLSEPELETGDQRELVQPKITFEQPHPSEHKLPPPGSAKRSSRITSARPDKLDAFTTAAKEAKDDLRAPYSRLVTAYENFESGWTWKSGKAVVIEGMQDLICQINTFIGANGDDAEWILAIANAFRKAGTDSSGLAKMSDSAIYAALQASRQDDYLRSALIVPALSLVGMNPTSGYSDDPINTVTGNFIEPEVDFTFEGIASSLTLTRMYNSLISCWQSQNLPQAPASGVFGIGWFTNLDQRLDIAGEVATDHQYSWLTGDGRRVYFPVFQGDTSSVRAEHENFWLAKRELCDYPFIQSVALSGASSWGWEISDNQGNYWLYDEHGLWIGQGSGVGSNVAVLRDDDLQQITALRHEWGRTLEFEYSDGLLAVARASDGRRVEFVYAEGHLVRVDGSLGSRSYVWNQDGLIEQVVSAAGVKECINLYDSDGRVRQQTSAFGRVIRYTYLPGNITEVSDSDGTRANTWIADQKGRTVGVVDSDEKRQSMRYDAYGNLIQVRDRGGNVTIHCYNERGLETRTILPSGGEISYEWDSADRLTLVVIENGSTVSYKYANERDRNPISITDALGGTTRLEWEKGLLRSLVDPTGVTLEFGYNEFGDLISVTNNYGEIFRLIRDESGRVLQTVSPMGNTVTVRYDERGLADTIEDACGARWRCEYDSAGRIVRTIDPYGAVERFEYGYHGQVVKVTDSLGRTSERVFDQLGNVRNYGLPDGTEYLFEYDHLSRLRSLTDPAGNIWRQDYDANGVPTVTTDPTGSVISSVIKIGKDKVGKMDGRGLVHGIVEFDKYGRPVKSTDLAGDSEIVTYDAAGNIVEALDAEGGLTQIERDLAGRVVKVTSPAGRVTHYEYDLVGRLATQTTGAGRVTRFSYNADGELITVVFPSGCTSSYEYDKCGRITRAVEPGRGVSEWHYDKCGRVVYSRDLVTGIRKFKYDSAGQLVKATNALGGYVQYAYDLQGRVTQKTDSLGGKTIYSYDDAGNLVTVIDPLGRKRTAEYDAAGRFVCLTKPDGQKIRTVYDASGQPTTITVDGRVNSKFNTNYRARTVTVTGYPDDATGNCSTFSFAFDRTGNLTEKRVIGADGSEYTSSWTYGKDGERRTYCDSSGAVTRYEYDKDGELIRLENSELGEAEFGYDIDGNLILAKCCAGVQEWEFHNGFIRSYHRICDGNSESAIIERDTWGRIISLRTANEIVSFLYNAAGQVVRAESNAGDINTWDYDSLGRISKHSRVRAADTTTYNFTYDLASELLLLHVTGAESKRIEYTYSPNGERLRAESTDGAYTRYRWDPRGHLAQIISRQANEPEQILDTTYSPLGQLYRVNDICIDWDDAAAMPTLSGIAGSPVAVLPGGTLLGLRGSSCAAGWRGTRSATGINPFDCAPCISALSKLLPKGSGISADGSLKLAGMEVMGVRIYDPITMGFLTEDPLSAPSGSIWEANPYNFAAGNPLSLSDPLGLKPVTDKDLRGIASGYNKYRFMNLIEGTWKRGLSWNVLISAGLIAAGVGLVASGFGSAFGSVLITAGIEGAYQQVNRGTTDWKRVAVTSIVGGTVGKSMQFAGAKIVQRIGPKLTLSMSSTVERVSEKRAAKFVKKLATDQLKGIVTDGVSSIALSELDNKENKSQLEIFKNGVQTAFDPSSRIKAAIPSPKSLIKKQLVQSSEGFYQAHREPIDRFKTAQANSVKRGAVASLLSAELFLYSPDPPNMLPERAPYAYVAQLDRKI